MSFIVEGISFEEFKTFIKTEIETVYQTAGLNPKQQFEKPTDTTQLLTRKEAAKRLQISLPTLSQWTKDGIVVGHRIATRVRYRAQDIDEALTKVQSLPPKRRAPGR